MNQSIIRITPEMYGYKDRGILKWQGMILSDHTDSLKRIKNDFEEVEPKEEMNEVEISLVLHKAFAIKSPVLLQANTIRNGNYYKDIECQVIGYNEGKIHLKLKDGRTTKCTIEEIRNVEFMNYLDWYEKRK